MLADDWPLLKRQEWGNHRPINRLPPELLSYIFVLYYYLGPETRQIGPDKKVTIASVHTAVPVVCRFWRKLAINTTTLWTCQCVGNQIPRETTKLFLSRAGTSTLLDIRITIAQVEDTSKRGGAGDIEHYRRLARESFFFILNNGGDPSRWRSLLVDTNIYAAFLAILALIRVNTMPELQHLELYPMAMHSPHPQDIREWHEAHDAMSPPKPLFYEPPAKLKRLAISGVPNSYLFGHMSHPEPRFTSLTHITITFSGYYPSTSQLFEMLCLNSQLVNLSLDCRAVGGYTVPEPPDGITYPDDIILSNLEVLSVTGIMYLRPWWILDVLGRLDGIAPNLVAFQLGFLIEVDGAGIFDFVMNCIAHRDRDDEPHFPSITSLSFGTFKGSIPSPEPLFVRYSRITELVLFENASANLELLLKRPWLLPKLSTLQVVLGDISTLKEVVVARCEGGLPLKTVVVYWETNDSKADPADRRLLESLVDLKVLYPSTSETLNSRSY